MTYGDQTQQELGISSRLGPEGIVPLEVAHRKLLSAYVDVLNALSSITVFPSWRKSGTPERTGELPSVARRRGLTWRFIIGLSAEAHIRGKCEEIGSALARQAQTENEADRKRVTSMQDSCKVIVDSLSSLERTKLLLPAIGGLSITALLGVLSLGVADLWPDFKGFTHYMNSHWVGALVGIPVLLAVVGYLFYVPSASFAYKRLAFLGHSLPRGKGQDATRRHGPERHRANVYESETKVVELLGRRKTMEARTDLALAFLGTGVLLSYVPLTVCVCFVHRWWTAGYVGGMVVLFLSLLAWGKKLWSEGSDRRWR